VLRLARGLVIEFAELSDPGRDPNKQINEDSSGAADTPSGYLALVCDGMGGHAEGQHASRIAVETVVEFVQAHSTEMPAPAVLRSAIEAAGRAVYQLGGASPMEMRPGSTCVAALLHEGGAEIAHVGDSRAYLLSAGKTKRLTRDHSMVQQMIDAGVLNEELARHHPDASRITRALGIQAEVEVEVRPRPLPLSVNDVLLLCCDGLTDLVTDEEISSVVRGSLATGVAFACQRLVELANERGGHDNITVQLIRILEAPRARAPIEPTLIDESLPTIPETSPTTEEMKTLPGVPDQSVEPAAGRCTEPAPAPLLPAPRPFIAEDRASALPSTTVQGRSLFLVSVAVVAAIVGGVILWWLLGF
jgi:serine/threonine protein phosphatase PrpC